MKIADNNEAALSLEQYAVVTANAQPLLVRAGAGSGKTRTLVYRVAKFIEDGMPAKTILLLTFTNRAAKSMLNRLEQLRGDDGRLVQGGTFHHVALQYLRLHAAALNYTAHFTLLDRTDSKKVMEAVLAEMSEELSHKKLPKANILLEILSLAMNTLTPMHEVIFSRFPRFYICTTEIAQIALAFMEKKLAMNVMDFDDLLINFRLLLTEHSVISDLIKKEIQAVLVDEYQDTNRLQSEIVDALVSSHGNLTVVGDDAQSIYGFRGADIDNMLEFTKRYPEALLLSLNTNYRSTASILSMANTSLAHAQVGFKKTLIPTRMHGEFPALVSCQNALQQANFIAQRILELKKIGIKLSEIAVLYRAHHHAIEIQMELRSRHIPFQLSSEAYSNELLLMQNLDINSKEEDEEKVSLSSIHQAKGLEWSHVFVIWLCEGRFPAEFSLRERKGIEEERRLFYVGITRAKDFLSLCYPRSYLQNDGRAQKLMKSRFIEELLLSRNTASQLENWILEEENDHAAIV